jgi:hypothetical protein
MTGVAKNTIIKLLADVGKAGTYGPTPNCVPVIIREQLTTLENNLQQMVITLSQCCLRSFRKRYRLCTAYKAMAVKATENLRQNTALPNTQDQLKREFRVIPKKAYLNLFR